MGLLEEAQESISARGLDHVLGQECRGWGGRPLPYQCLPLALVQRKVYLVEAVLMSFLRGVMEAGTPVQAQSVVRQVLDLLWLFMEVRLLTSGLRPRWQAPPRWERSREGGLGKGPEMAAWGLASTGQACSAASLPQDHEVQDCLKHLMMSLLRLYRFSPIVPDLGLQVGAPVPAPSPLGLSCPL